MVRAKVRRNVDADPSVVRSTARTNLQRATLNPATQRLFADPCRHSSLRNRQPGALLLVSHRTLQTYDRSYCPV